MSKPRDPFGDVKNGDAMDLPGGQSRVLMPVITYLTCRTILRLVIAPKALTSPDAEDPMGLRPILGVSENHDFCEG